MCFLEDGHPVKAAGVAVYRRAQRIAECHAQLCAYVEFADGRRAGEGGALGDWHTRAAMDDKGYVCYRLDRPYARLV